MTHGVIFDLDETLIDRHASISVYASRLYADFTNDIALPEDQFIERFLELDGNGYTPRETLFGYLSEELVNEEVPANIIGEHFAEYAWDRPVLMEGAITGCTELRRAGVPLGIVTNGGSINQRKKLRNTGLDQLVHHVVISEEFGAGKPDMRIFLEVCERLNIEPEDSWFIGDNPMVDIVGASNAGFKTIWLKRALPWPSEQRPCYKASVPTLVDAFKEMGVYAYPAT